MLESAAAARIALTTTATDEDARRLGRILVEERLAACATLILAVESVYAWKGKVETGRETMLLLKTGAAQLPALEARLHQLHPYDTPEFLVLAVEAGSHAYLVWMADNLAVPT
jgi:periplasmic divalent cation tolerance protein